jgi:hypothetical protein
VKVQKLVRMGGSKSRENGAGTETSSKVLAKHAEASLAAVSYAVITCVGLRLTS